LRPYRNTGRPEGRPLHQPKARRSRRG